MIPRLAAALAALAFLTAGASAPPAVAPAPLLIGEDYPIEVSISVDAALFHWLESLTGASLGKTIPAYRAEYQAHFGEPSAQDRRVLEAFAALRLEHAKGPASGSDDDDGMRGLVAMRRVFMTSPDAATALRTLDPELTPEQRRNLELAMDRFRPSYLRLWRDGAIPRAFVDSARSDPSGPRLARLLVSIARFFRVDPKARPWPRLVLTPVPAGWGTHAEALGESLLIELREGDRLADQASVIVHENSHFLFTRIPRQRQDELEAVARALPRGDRAWDLMHEALPTALGQGVADRQFRPQQWSARGPWYHTQEVSAYAAALYPLVQDTLDSGGRFDRTFVRRAVALLP